MERRTNRRPPQRLFAMFGAVALAAAIAVVAALVWTSGTKEASADLERIVPSEDNTLSSLLEGASARQVAALSDGVVTSEEYSLAADSFEACVLDAYPTATIERTVGFGGKITFVATSGALSAGPYDDAFSKTARACGISTWSAVDLVKSQQSAPSPEYIQEAREAMAVCMGVHDIDVEATSEAFSYFFFTEEGRKDDAAHEALRECNRSVADEQFGLPSFFGS